MSTKSNFILTPERLSNSLREFVESLDDDAEDEYYGSERRLFEPMVFRLCDYLGIPPMRELTELEKAEKAVGKAYDAWQAAIAEVNRLKDES